MYISQTILILFIFVVLFVYVIYLHIQLTKKNIILKSVYKKINKPNSKLSEEDIVQFLENIKNPNFSGTVTKDKLLDKKIREFLFEDEQEVNLFLHYTPSKEIADKILSEGFQFVNSFYKTAEYIYNDELYLVHRHHEHKQFGDFVIVICIAKKTYKYYTQELNNLKIKNISVEQLLTESAPYIDENSEEVYILPKQFVKGYFNYTNAIIVRNSSFNSNYSSKHFENNLRKITSK